MKLADYIAEVTECDFKASLESEKPKSWLKSVSAFANGIGGYLFFGVDNDKNPKGLDDAQKTADKISEMIVGRISPLPEFKLEGIKEDDADILILKVSAGRSTPYYYVYDNTRTAYIRAGNESVPAPDHILNELILKGQNKTFDSTLTKYKKADYSFTLMEATYRQRANLNFEPKDYVSFGLADNEGILTIAGALLADQNLVYNSRVFCTRWNGLKKGSVFDDAIDDKEFEGNLISLLNSSCEFIKNNSKVRFKKEATYRVDKPDYAERAVTEAMVNALIHRQYIQQGTEIHIDMYDDRVEITSPGGMVEGGNIQNKDIDEITSARRNPVIADLFHRMKFMERRGSGLQKIVDETAKLPGYTDELKPRFVSTDSTFKVVLMNVNYMADDENVSAIETEVSAIGDKVSAVEARIAEIKMDVRTRANVNKLFAQMGTEKIFGRNDVSEICNISYSTAGTFIAKMKEYKLIEEVTGHGKGKCKFMK